MHSVTVPASSTPLRLDLFLAQQVPQCSRRRVQRAITDGDVRINGRRARKGEQVVAGDVVQVPETLYAPLSLQPNPALRLPILYEDASVIAVDKPPGIASHALRPDETETVANFLLWRYPEVAVAGRTLLEGGAVHRLDTDTSGVLLVARSAGAYRTLRQQFEQRTVIKDYLAIVEGDVRLPGEVRTPITSHRNHRMVQVTTPSDRSVAARPAVTVFRPRQRLGRFTLLEVEIRTGVRHQIRAHLASIGHAVIGDQLYGSPAAATGAPRQLLHAHRVSLRHPETSAPLRVESPVPADLTAFIQRHRNRKRTLRHQARQAK